MGIIRGHKGKEMRKVDFNRAVYLKKEDVHPHTGSLKPAWRLYDASGKILGRLASEVAVALMGKDKASYTPHVLSGDYVVVVNAEKIVLSGKKLEQKLYRRHSGYIGGMKVKTAEEMLETKPEEVIRLAVKRMLPKNKLANRMIKRLKVYRGAEHPHAAQLSRYGISKS